MWSVMLNDVICCLMMLSDVIWCKVMLNDVKWSYVMLNDVNSKISHLFSLVAPLAGKADHWVGTDGNRSVLIRFILGGGGKTNYQSIVDVSPQFKLWLPLLHSHCAGTKYETLLPDSAGCSYTNKCFSRPWNGFCLVIGKALTSLQSA